MHCFISSLLKVLPHKLLIWQSLTNTKLLLSFWSEKIKKLHITEMNIHTYKLWVFQVVESILSDFQVTVRLSPDQIWVRVAQKGLEVKVLRSSLFSRSFSVFSLSRSACSLSLSSAAEVAVGSAGLWGGQSEPADLLLGRSCALLCSSATASANRLLCKIDSTEGLR